MDNINRITSEEYLKSIALPDTTKSYRPFSHGQLIDLTKEHLDKNNLYIKKETYLTADDGALMTGKFQISSIEDNEMALTIMLQNSYNKKVTAKIACGFHVFVCSNSACVGDMGSLRKKHTGEISTIIPATIASFTKRLGDYFEDMVKQREIMKNIEITKRISAELVGRMFVEEDIITSTQLNIINREIKAPSFDYKAKDSLWELYQFTTSAMKEAHPLKWLDSHIDAHNFFINECSSISGMPIRIHSPIETIEESKFKQLELFAVN